MGEELGEELAGRLRAAGLDPHAVTDLAAGALAEDLAGGTDVTTAAIIAPDTVASAAVVARAGGVVAGLPVAEAVFRIAAAGQRGAPPAPAGGGPPPATDRSLTVRTHATDGARVSRDDVLMTISGPLAGILVAERTALNLLSHLSGVATLTRRWVDAVDGTGARIRDTRKTLPGLRAVEKYAVRCGGGVNHRMSLSDAALIKDNHVAAAGSVAAAYAAVTGRATGITVEVECDTLGQVDEAVRAGADLILLDNFGIPDMAEAVRRTAGRARLEASGGLTLDRARAVAMTGVDYLSVGALTHSAPALDIALDVAPRPAGAER
ncbi:MAG TPA: carboxylating nicotinate-nucleotide diphosphorylase [Streptosporangiaceae bacterium]|jgi:nicotinate-nucleotide pyrophosphorylase (carboxylating)